MWHCPHCGAPQAETARCWVCRRSSTTCSTCRHFRASLAADVGYCALDRRRRPLTGTELRGCWTERAAAPAAVPDAPASRRTTSPESAADRLRRLPARGFVPVEQLGAEVLAAATVIVDPIGEPGQRAPAFLPGEAADGWAARTSLFGDAER